MSRVSKADRRPNIGERVRKERVLYMGWNSILLFLFSGEQHTREEEYSVRCKMMSKNSPSSLARVASSPPILFQLSHFFCLRFVRANCCAGPFSRFDLFHFFQEMEPTKNRLEKMGNGKHFRREFPPPPLLSPNPSPRHSSSSSSSFPSKRNRCSNCNLPLCSQCAERISTKKKWTATVENLARPSTSRGTLGMISILPSISLLRLSFFLRV